MEIRVSATAELAARDAADLLAEQLRNAIRRRGTASLAISGGNTPASMVALLAATDVAWTSVRVWQVDERVAPAGTADRNSHLLNLLALAGAAVSPMPVEDTDLAAACRGYAADLPERFDVVHLGLGSDGHTASWPPGDPVVESSAKVATVGEYRGRPRMTLTPAVVNHARHRLVLVTGPDKATAVRRWLLRDTALPIERVVRAGTIVVLDEAAAGLLPHAGRSARKGG